MAPSDALNSYYCHFKNMLENQICITTLQSLGLLYEIACLPKTTNVLRMKRETKRSVNQTARDSRKVHEGGGADLLKTVDRVQVG